MKSKKARSSKGNGAGRPPNTSTISKPQLAPVVKPLAGKAKTRNTLPDAYRQYHDSSLADYVYGLLHPDVVAVEGLDIKLPARIPVPTTSWSFKDTFAIQPNDHGYFAISWSPNFLGSKSKMQSIWNPGYSADYINFSTLQYCIASDLRGNNAGSSLPWVAHTFKEVKQEFAKFRLTSACLKVKYTGPVLQQSGCIASCASYVPMPIIEWRDSSNADTTILTALRPAYSWIQDFDTIRQGQWAKTVSLVDKPSGLTCTYLPSDPLSETFVNNATCIDMGEISPDVSSPQRYTMPNTANLNYAIAGWGLPVLPCITVEVYTNYEVIVLPESIPYFRPKVFDARLTAHEDVILKVVKGVANGNGLISETKQHEDRSVMKKLQEVLAKAARFGMNNLPAILSIANLLV